MTSKRKRTFANAMRWAVGLIAGALYYWHPVPLALYAYAVGTAALLIMGAITLTQVAKREEQTPPPHLRY